MLIDKISLFKWDERRDLIIPGDNATTLAFSVQHFISAANQAIKDHGHFYVALSGGSTPKAIFEYLCLPPNTERIDWSKVFLFWSDERSVPPDHEESNFHMAMTAGLDRMPIPPSQIFRMESEKDIEQNARKYEETIRKVLQGRAFDLIMLGMGDDGHTASLFPQTSALSIHDRLVVANFISQKNTWRMTMTFECINSASHIVIYVMGASKKHMVAQALLAKDPLDLFPIQRVGTPSHKALWILDEAAAATLISEKNIQGFSQKTLS